MNLGLDEDLLEEIDAKYEELATQAAEEDITRAKGSWADWSPYLARNSHRYPMQGYNQTL